jgi:hypothetical protein
MGAPGIVMRGRLTGWSIVAIALLMSCARQREPAERALAEIHAIVVRASPDAAKYVPAELMRTQQEIDALELSFGRQEYAAVLSAAPQALEDARHLAAVAAARKRDVLQGLAEDWSRLAPTLPEAMTGLRGRIDSLAKLPRTAAGFDAAAARDELQVDEALWSKAQAAFATGNLNEAVSTAKTLETALAELAGKLPRA